MFDSNGKTFRIPGGYIVPVLSIIVILWFLSNLSQNKLMGLGIYIMVLTIIYFIINSNIIKRVINKKNR